MPSSTSLLGFVAAALVVLLIPGPAVLYIVARSLSQGHRAGLVSVLGLSVGALVHVAAATAGLSAILLASAAAFGVVKALGAGYLIYPKIAVFFLAFLPQFVEPSRGPVPAQVLFLGLIYVTLALFTDSAYALLAGSLRHLLGGPLMEGALPRYAGGVRYIGLGVTTALIGRRH